MNHKIRAVNVRCINAEGQMLGVIAVRDAMRMATEQGLDLVEISPNAEPPVCRIMDFGKYRYEESQKEKQMRKNQQRQVIKEVKFHANVGDHDYQTKLTHMRDFLSDGLKVKVTLVFRGRENAHRELGFDLINRLLKDCEVLATVDMPPKMMGRMLVAMLSPRPAKPGGAAAPRPAAPPAARPPAPAVAPVSARPVAPAMPPATLGESGLDKLPANPV